MKLLLAILCSGALGVGGLFAQERVAEPPVVAFRAIDVFVDSGAQPLAAYQIEFSAPTGSVKIVSIEGGEHTAFRQPPYHDPKAIQQERAVLAAFSTAAAGQLPSGRTRVATVHVQVSGVGAPKYSARLQAAAGRDGQSIRAEISVMERNVP